MKKCSVSQDGFYGKYCPIDNTKAIMLVITDDDVDDTMSKVQVKWFHSLGISALALSPLEKGCHSYPLEFVENAIGYCKEKGYTKIGVIGISASAMVALTSASMFHDITLTIGLTPSDYVMEGYYQDKKDGAPERPGDFEPSLTYHGQPIPFLPYAYRHPEYYNQIKAESKRRGDFIAGKDMFDESERRHPLQEEEKIKVENIHGHLYLAGAKDDVMWDTCRYISRMQKRLEKQSHHCTYEIHIYEHGTHFVFPESMARKILPVGINFVLPKIFKEAKGYTKECEQTRLDIDKTLISAIRKWENEN